MSGQAKTLVVIDGKSVLYRGYYAMGNLATPDGRPTGATYGFAMMGLRVLKEFEPDYVVVAWDKSKTNIRARQQLYEEYKANRLPMPDDLAEQIPDVRRLCEAFGWPLLEVDDFEADDIMGTLAVQAKAHGIDSVLVTSDLDVLQLLNHHTKVCALKRGLTQTVLYDAHKLQEEYGLTPEQFVDYKALRGDPSDNIPGVKGVGEKTATQLVQEYGSLESVYQNVDTIGGAVANKLEADKDMAFLSRDLIQLSLEVPVEFDEVASRVEKTDPEAIRRVFADLHFQRLQSELPVSMQHQAPSLFDNVAEPATRTQLDMPQIRSTEDVHYDQAVVLADSNQALVSPDPEVAYLLAKSSEATIARIIAHDAKHVLKYMSGAVALDIMVAAFLLDPLRRDISLAGLASEDIGVDIPEPEPDIWQDHDALAATVAAMWRLYDTYQQQLAELPGLQAVAENIEWPLMPVLARMEQAGIKLDTEYLGRMQQDFQERITKLQQVIFEHAGQEFNINSPHQLQEILFEKLQLPTEDIKKTKTGYSTGASELEKLRGTHPIIENIVHYRELAKLQSTYVEALPKSVGGDGRLHTTFTQTVTQTGRLSSLHPNLQNIPVRSEEGRAIRRAFTAEEGSSLVQADYSQIELRVAAALSGDKKMIQAFRDGADIHTQTAAELHGVPTAEVTKTQRYSAKTVNFGVLYGMSPHGLSAATGMSREEAKEFIDRYFAIRSQLLEYLEGLKQQAKTEGYVETWFGRRRPMPDIHSSNFAVRSAAERAAMNMPIQGTAADIMKLAMVEIDKRLDPDCYQILQVHDSVLVECPKDKSGPVAKQLQDIMENITNKLPVPFEVEATIGSHWGEL